MIDMSSVGDPVTVRYPRIPAPEKVHGIDAMTMREREIMAAVIEQGDYGRAADALGTSRANVKGRMETVREKLDCVSNVQAAVIFDRWMREQGAAE